jgi:hypothetical protein
MSSRGVREHVVATIANATSQDVALAPVPEGYSQTLERIALRDRSNACTRVEILISRGGDEYPVADQATLTADQIYWRADPVTLYEREYLIFRFVGTTLADTVDAWAIGQEVS